MQEHEQPTGYDFGPLEMLVRMNVGGRQSKVKPHKEEK
jgi:hypothetical protein